MTVAYDHLAQAWSYELYKKSPFGRSVRRDRRKTKKSTREQLRQVVSGTEAVVGGLIGGRESVVFLAPMGAHNTIAVQAWQAVAQWDLQLADDGSVDALRYGTAREDPEYRQATRQTQDPRLDGRRKGRVRRGEDRRDRWAAGLLREHRPHTV